MIISGKTPVIVIDVPDVEKHLEMVEKAGGKVVMTIEEIGDMGLYARVSDTEGNIIGIWQSRKK